MSNSSISVFFRNRNLPENKHNVRGVNNEQSIINATKFTSTCSICYQNNNVNCYNNTILNLFWKNPNGNLCINELFIVFCSLI